jgi:hypothetical protein
MGNNLLSFKESGLSGQILLPVHSHAGNISFMGPFLQKINEAFKNDNRFQVYFAALNDSNQVERRSMIGYGFKTNN